MNDTVLTFIELFKLTNNQDPTTIVMTAVVYGQVQKENKDFLKYRPANKDTKATYMGLEILVQDHKEAVYIGVI